MWSLRNKVRQRRVETRRRDAATGGLSLWRRFRDMGGVGSTLLAVGFYLAVLLMDLWPIDPMPYHHEGQFVQHDVYARVSFQVPSPKKMSDEESKIKTTTAAVFRLDNEGLKKFLDELKAFPDSLKSTSRPSDLPPAALEGWAITPESMRAWKLLTEVAKRRQYNDQVDKLGKELAKTPFVDKAQLAAQMARGAHDVALTTDSQTTTVSKMELVDTGNNVEVARRIDQMAKLFDPPLRDGIAKQLHNLLTAPTTPPAPAPNYIYDDVASAKAVSDALNALHSSPPLLVFDAHVPGDKIVQAGNLTTSQLDLLREEQRQYMAVQDQTTPYWWIWLGLGRAVTIAMICLLLGVYVYRYEREVISDHWQGCAVTLVLLAALAINRAAMFSPYSEPVSVLAVLMAVTVLTIARNQRFALIIAIILSLLAMHQLRGSLWQFIVLLIGSSATVLQVREIRSRSRLIEIGAVSAAVVFVSVCAVATAASLPWKVMLPHATYAAVAALLVGFLTQGLLPLIERFFRVATSMTLLEWCDATRTLLKRLSLEAPGTFNHSLQLGSICEAAAEAIGARGLLARAGAYYHDIGKINKPEYFVENQGGMPNPHAKLSPAMSLLIIIGHVKDGLEMAREYGLPPVLREFIASHHGTTLVQYFYHAATEQRKADIDRAPDEVEFRYPGPKPRSKEAAILMLADASESSVRAMPEPTPGRIENQVHTMVTHRLMDGQLDDCYLTLREVHQIEASLVRGLCGMYHSRIPYPKLAGQKPAQSEARRTNGNGKDGDDAGDKEQHKIEQSRDR